MVRLGCCFGRERPPLRDWPSITPVIDSYYHGQCYLDEPGSSIHRLSHHVRENQHVVEQYFVPSAYLVTYSTYFYHCTNYLYSSGPFLSRISNAAMTSEPCLCTCVCAIGAHAKAHKTYYPSITLNTVGVALRLTKKTIEGTPNVSFGTGLRLIETSPRNS